MNVVTDTHALVWYFMDDKRIGKEAIELFEGIKNDVLIIVPTIVIAEIMYITMKGRITLSFENTVQLIEENDNFDIVPLDLNIIKIANNVTVDLEMHDRLIVSTALHYNCGLITKDKEIKNSGLINIHW